MQLPRRTLANDIHSKLNRTRHRSILFPSSAGELRSAVESSPGVVAFCGARHAMGGQQFVDGGTLVSRRGSTVIDVQENRVSIIREGEISAAQLEQVLGAVKMAQAE